jgi:hypothetical protein
LWSTHGGSMQKPSMHSTSVESWQSVLANDEKGVRFLNTNV